MWYTLHPWTLGMTPAWAGQPRKGSDFDSSVCHQASWQGGLRISEKQMKIVNWKRGPRYSEMREREVNYRIIKDVTAPLGRAHPCIAAQKFQKQTFLISDYGENPHRPLSSGSSGSWRRCLLRVIAMTEKQKAPSPGKHT